MINENRARIISESYLKNPAYENRKIEAIITPSTFGNKNNFRLFENP